MDSAANAKSGMIEEYRWRDSETFAAQDRHTHEKVVMTWIMGFYVQD
jgi:hypothetical protein